MKTYKINELTSGAAQDKNTLKCLREVISGKAFVIADGKTYRVVEKISAKKLTSGNMYLSTYNRFNQVASVDKLLNIMDGGQRLFIQPSEGNFDMGTCYYLHQGKYCAGSGAEPLTFYSLNEV